MEGARFGAHLSSWNDIADKWNDLLVIGAPGYEGAGTVFVYDRGHPRDVFQQIEQVSSPQNNDQLGAAAVGLDANGDGISSLVIGVPLDRHDAGPERSGDVMMVFREH